MQIYIIGIGQCGTSIAYDVIAELTGFTKSKSVTLAPEHGASDEASNQLETLLNKDLGNRSKWSAQLRTWLSRIVNPTSPRKVFIRPKIAIVDGNPDNFVKNAFQRFRGGLAPGDGDDRDLQELALLINSVQVLGLGSWQNGCANGIVGETVASLQLLPAQFQARLGVDGNGKLVPDGGAPPVRVHLVVSSAAGATGSGGGAYLSQGNALVQPAPDSPLVLNALVLPSIQSSANNPKYALNAGRALARHANVIVPKAQGKGAGRGSSAVLFSNPANEGDSEALQTLNDYIAEFFLRLANFTFAGNVARVARDLDPSELTSFLAGKASVLGMSHLVLGSGEGDVEERLVQKAFGDLYDRKDDRRKPEGLSVERELKVDADGEPLDVLADASSVLVVVGLPPGFHGGIDIQKIVDCIRRFSNSDIRGGVRTFAYGSAKNLELTVLLRYRRWDAFALARHFIGRYVDLADATLSEGTIDETEYLKLRAEGDDDIAEMFEETVRDLEHLGGLDHFDRFVLRDIRR